MCHAYQLDLRANAVVGITVITHRPSAARCPVSAGQLLHGYCPALSAADSRVCADVHMVLADVSMEQENFEAGAEDYATALKLLTSAEQVGASGLSSALILTQSVSVPFYLCHP